MSRSRVRASLGLALLAACGPAPTQPSPRRPVGSMAAAESSFASVRDLRDRIDVAVASAARATSDGFPLERAARHYDSLRAELAKRLQGVDSAALTDDDPRALGVMRLTLARDLGPVTIPSRLSGAPDTAAPGAAPDCSAAAMNRAGAALDSLRSRIYACYGWAQSHVSLGHDTLDRLSILGQIGRAQDPAARRELFLALAPVWRSVNGDNAPTSPYRRLIALEAGSGTKGASVTAAQARGVGVPPDSLERWLIAILEAWHDAASDSLLEPWDWYYESGRASRALSPRISRDRLVALNAQVWEALGVNVRRLRVHYDLDARDGKDPVAYTTFGSRSPTIEPWVFATYRSGGLDNLNELLHETGHAAHIAAIRTRPAFRDWPDSDPFTEAVADVAALDVYEPVWQQRWLGDSVSLAEGLRARYGGIVMDVAWALFEVRMLREPGSDPNLVWTTLTRDYLRIRPHPELSWWAMRGQLVDAPGYMMNYAIGAILIAAIRQRIRTRHGPFTTGDPTWYGWVAPRLYRFGLERTTRQVVEEFLGGAVSPAAILADMRRMRAPGVGGAATAP